MAQRRMFSKEITTSDKFVDMPQSTRLLYYDLGMEADDEGFIGNARMLSRAYGANIDDLKLLQAKGFIIIFESGVTVVKDWNVNNKIRKDRIKPTIYTDEKSMLSLDNTGVYQLVNQMSTKCQPNVNQMSAQNRVGEVRLGKDRLDEDRGGYTPPPPKSNLNFGQFVRAEGLKVNDNHIQRLLDYIGLDGMDMDLVKLAVSRTTEQGIVAPAYTFSILDNWKKKGFTTVEQANQEQEEFEQHKSRSITPPQKSNVPEWSNPDYKAPTLDELKVEIPEGYVEDPDAF